MHDELILLAASSVPRNRGSIDKYLAGYSTIQFVCKFHGSLFVAYDSDEYMLSDGEWFFPAHPGPRTRFHILGPDAHWHHRHIGFQGPLVESWRARGLWLTRPQRAPQGRDWPAWMDELIALARRPESLARLRAINMLEGLLLELADARQSATLPEDPWLQRVLERLDAEWSPDLSALAASFGLSETALRRRFKHSTGITMQQHVLQRRMAAARALLADTDLPLKAIAAQLGYQNVYFFSRQFRQLCGVPPGVFRSSRASR